MYKTKVSQKSERLLALMPYLNSLELMPYYSMDPSLLESPNLGGDSRNIELLETVDNSVYQSQHCPVQLATFVLHGQGILQFM